MTNRAVILADSIAYLPHLAAWDLMFLDRFSALQLDAVLVYIIDTVPAAALPYLAEQFDVLGFEGYQLATTDAQRRDVIKRALEIKRYKGTVWAVKESLKTIGYDNIVITEHVAGHWAKFSITLATGAVLTANTASDIIRMVYAFKNTRSHLDSIRVDILVEDDLIFLEDDAFVNESLEIDDELRLTGTLQYNGVGIYNGDYDHSGDSDVVIIN